MRSFSHEELEILESVKNSISQGEPFIHLLDKYKEKQVAFYNFLGAYCIVFLSVKGRYNDAIKLNDILKLSSSFISRLCLYIKNNSGLKPKTTVFKSYSPFSLWTKTEFYQRLFDEILIGVKHLKLKEKVESLSILDIGSGNGHMTSAIVKEIIKQEKADKVKLILVDKFQDMLNSAKDHCSKDIKGGIELFSILADAKDSKNLSKNLAVFAPFDLVICSVSIHHMQRTYKVDLLKELRKMTSSLIIVEVNAEHDIPESDDPVFIASVIRCYDFIIDTLLYSNSLTENEKNLAIDEFAILEAINIITQDYEKRIDCHTSIAKWKEIANEAGFLLDFQSNLDIYNDGEPFAFLLTFS